MQFGHVELKQSHIGQFEDKLGVFATRDFKKGEIVLKWKLSVLTKEQYTHLPALERENFCHLRKGVIYYYPDPERHVNRSKTPNLISDFETEADIAMRDIKKGEELSIADTTVEDF